MISQYQKIINSINEASIVNNYTMFLFKNSAKYAITKSEQWIKNGEINIILLLNFNKFFVDDFYKHLIQKITINKEIINTSDKYSFLCDGYTININLTNDRNLDLIESSDFTINKIFLNPNTNEIDAEQDYLYDLKNNIISKIHNTWTVTDILELCYLSSTISDSVLSEKTNNFIELNSIHDICKNKNILLDILLLSKPGKNLSIIKQFKDGSDWITNAFLDLSSSLNIPINENFQLSQIYSEKNLKIIDVYNEFLMYSESGPESNSSKLARLNASMKLFLDSTDLNIQIPYINKISTISLFGLDDKESNALKEQEIRLFDAYPCPGGNCPPCNPSECDPQCCCCVSSDIISAINIRCHKRAVLSCNADATGYGPGANQQFNDCPSCVTACQTILGLRPDLEGESCDNFTSIGHNEGWWNVPIENWPCICNCAQTNGDTCDLTCVTCNNIYCRSNVSVAESNCSYQFTISPGTDCCQGASELDIMFVADYGPVNQNAAGNLGYNFQFNTNDIITGLVNFYSGSRVSVRFGLVSLGQNHSGSDINLVRFVSQLTDKNSFLSTLPTPDSTLTTDEDPLHSAKYEGIHKAQANATWRSGAQKIVVLVARPNEWKSFRTLLSGCDRNGMSCTGFEGDYRCVFPPCAIESLTVNSVLDNSHIVVIFPSSIPGDDFPYLKDITDWQLHSVCDDFPDVCNTLIENPQESDLKLVMDNDHSPFSFINTEFYGYAFNSTNYSGLLDPTTGRDFFEELSQTNIVFGHYPSSCDCVSNQTTLVRRNSPECLCCREDSDPCIDDPFDQTCLDNLPESCFNIPINKCLPGQHCDCSIPFALNVCGSIITVEPHHSNLICCSELDGCDCSVNGTGDVECCGPDCFDICSMYAQNPNIEEIIDFIWADCWSKKVSVDTDLTPNCTDPCCPNSNDPESNDYPCELRDPGSSMPCCPCLIINQNDCCNCCIRFLDENGLPNTVYCRNEIANQVTIAINSCPQPGGGGDEPPGPPPTWDPPNAICIGDKCIVGNPIISDTKDLDNQCDQIGLGCISVQHPSSVVLNNGIGLVAYESFENNSIIKIQQFHTSVNVKILPNREFNFGRLQNKINWTTIAKIYIYEDITIHLLSTITFKNGPLEKQFFPLTDPAIGIDAVGKYISFYLPDNLALTHEFKSIDDVYNIQYLIFDFEDSGFIGDAFDTTSNGSEFDISNRRVVDKFLMLEPHIYNGSQVPVAYPNITSAPNYSNGFENSHFVYLTYQALENNKWNIYLRQLRISEYDKQNQINDAITENNISSISSLNINNIIYKVFCVDDKCSQTGSQYILTRLVVFSVITENGQDVLNPGLSGDWGSLCPGVSQNDFPKEKVFVQFSHNVLSNKCPDQFAMNSIFNNWVSGQEFFVPASTISPEDLFTKVSIKDDDHIDLGMFSPVIIVGGCKISSSFVNATWYRYITQSSWSIITDPALSVLEQFKGFDISEPICLTNGIVGHCTKPVVKVNYSNDVFVCFETTETGLQQIKLLGTSKASSSLPFGDLNPRNLDKSFDYFFKPTDFSYKIDITNQYQGINQLPDMFIDKNDVVHITWQSNRDNYWEIYYANSENSFENKRITNYISRSLKPSICGDNLGRIFITWHDDRFNNGYEIMIAYYPGTRILPLAQQDPYMSSLRNNYIHYSNIIHMSIVNSTTNVLCIKNLIVDFFSDRTLTDLKFSIRQDIYPFLFKFDDFSSDNTVQTYVSFSGWSENDDPYLITSTSSEYDSYLFNSCVIYINTQYTVFDDTINPIEIAFKCSDIPNNPLSQWSDFKPIVNGTTAYSQFGSERPCGRYKSIKIKLTYSSHRPNIQSLSITSEVLQRVCIGIGESTHATLSLTPDVRIDSVGENKDVMSIPIAFSKNNTYFIRTKIIDENGLESFASSNLSASCEECSGSSSTWNLESCSIKNTINNVSNLIEYYNFKYTFYYDSQRKRKIYSFEIKPESSDLKYITVNDISGESAWKDKGIKVSPGSSLDVIFWPLLSPISGLICGIDYYVRIEYCKSNETQDMCDLSRLSPLKNIKWSCNCQSIRWSPSFEDKPININQLTRWVSSGSGYSDTRLTETINSNNINAKIKIRSNLNGVIIYESNRKDQHDLTDNYKLYASVFSIIPNFGMYASGAQNINSPFASIVYKSDIPLCKSQSNEIIGCFDSHGVKINDIITGKNASFDLDQFDNIFLSAEVNVINNQCNRFAKDQQKYLTVHVCGADALNLFQNALTTPETLDFCDSSQIVRKSSNQIINQFFNNIARVKSQYILYHITKNNIITPVVEDCNIKLEIIGSHESIAARLRNSSKNNWSKWYDFNKPIDENTIEISWILEPVSGDKTVEIQFATYDGISKNYSLNILANYKKVNFIVNFYKTETIKPPDIVDLKNEVIWSQGNLLPLFNNFPVAAVNKPVSQQNQIVLFENSYIFIEIIPDITYLTKFSDISDQDKLSGNSQIEPLFNFAHQGYQDYYNQKTIWARNSEGKEVFRGVVKIQKNNNSGFKDGLAFIYPNFRKDCSSNESENSEQNSGIFSSDQFNVFAQTAMSNTISRIDDGLQDVTGKIKYQIKIRPTNDDPYLIFGNPDYRLEENINE